MLRLKVEEGALVLRTPAAAERILSLAPDEGVADRADEVNAAEVIELCFPTFKDGRPFSQARHLRRMGVRGDVRARGALLPDQIRFAIGVGFTSFDLETTDDVDLVRSLTQRFPVSYQPRPGARAAWSQRV